MKKSLFEIKQELKFELLKAYYYATSKRYFQGLEDLDSRFKIFSKTLNIFLSKKQKKFHFALLLINEDYKKFYKEIYETLSMH